MTTTIDVLQTAPGAPLVAVLPEAKVVGIGSTERPATTDLPERLAGAKHARWGDGDRWPTDVREKVELVPMAMATMYKLAAMMYGNGLVYFDTRAMYGGELERVQNRAVEDFLERNRVHRWFMAQCVDYRLYFQSFSELKRSRRGAIVGLHHKPAEFCRLAKQNPNTLRIDNLLYSPYFAECSAHDKNTATLPLLDGADPDRLFRVRPGVRTAAYHSHFPTPGILYYARPYWVGLYRSGGWLDVAANVPKIITAMQNNQVAIKYQINIPESYFEARHPDWIGYTAEERQKLIETRISSLNEMLSSTDNLMKSISTVFKEDPVTRAAFGKIEILAVDDKAKRDVWVPDSTAADQQIVQGLGMHPSQMGLQPAGGKMGAGSGSDQRESFNTLIALNTIDQQILLEPLNLISRYNGWGVTFMVDHTLHVAQNVDKTGTIAQISQSQKS